jgi:uncharacterized protein YdhG (YjbR/CyaY superfamily)
MKKTAAGAKPATIDQYISTFPPAVRTILRTIKRTVRDAVPEAEETISYRMPAFKLEGVLLYFAAFNNHIGLFPPVKGDASLERAVKRYAGPKGNLRFPYDEPIPYGLIKRIVRFRAKRNLEKAHTKMATR